MLLKVTAKRQVTFPRSVLESLGVRQGDRIELIEGPDGYLLRPRRIDYSRLGTLRDKNPAGHPPFVIRSFREKVYDPTLRD